MKNEAKSTAKSKLTKYIEQQVLIGRIEEAEWWSMGFGDGLKSAQDRLTTLKAQLEEWKK